jgi:hypothetical protein
MGQVDLAKMRAGNMDPEGRGATQGGWICSILGAVLNVLMLLACGTPIAISAWNDINQSQQIQKPGFQAPPQPMPPGGPAPKDKDQGW